MPTLRDQLDLDRCPHCQVDRPRLKRVTGLLKTADYKGEGTRYWAAYQCVRCGGCVLTFALTEGGEMQEVYPSRQTVDASIPITPRSYLEQAISSVHAPAGAVMLAASAIDAMLKSKGYKEGSLYQRIEQAAREHMITEEMASWAHDVRLDANDQRHADENAALPTSSDATKCIEFASALAQFLFVLPARVERGRKKAQEAT